MSKSGWNIPEAVGFGVLGATIGFVACGLLGHEAAAHEGLGMATGAILMIGAAHLPVRRFSVARQGAHRPGNPADRPAPR